MNQSQPDLNVQSTITDYFLNNQIDNNSSTDSEEISSIAKHLNKRKAPGDDSISNIALIQLPERSFIFLLIIIIHLEFQNVKMWIPLLLLFN